MAEAMGNAEQVRAIVEPTAKAAASAAIRDFVNQHPHFAPPSPKVEIPPTIKWAGIIISALMTAAVIGSCFWVVTTLNELQLTVREISTRQITDTTGKEIDELKRRVTVLEQQKAMP